MLIQRWRYACVHTTALNFLHTLHTIVLKNKQFLINFAQTLQYTMVPAPVNRSLSYVSPSNTTVTRMPRIVTHCHYERFLYESHTRTHCLFLYRYGMWLLDTANTHCMALTSIRVPSLVCSLLRTLWSPAVMMAVWNCGTLRLENSLGTSSAWTAGAMVSVWIHCCIWSDSN